MLIFINENGFIKENGFINENGFIDENGLISENGFINENGSIINEEKAKASALDNALTSVYKVKYVINESETHGFFGNEKQKLILK